MELQIHVKGMKEPLSFKGDRIDILDFNLNGVEYKQVRFFRKGFSKSEYIESKLITKIKEINK